MEDLTVQRTLVKSPPELWADLSNEALLGRRLSEFGEIRITRLIPEKTVAWEGDRASGTVDIEPSGWGTKVRLSAQPIAPASDVDVVEEDVLEREAADAAAVMAEIEREAAIEAALRAEVEHELELEAAGRAEAEAEAIAAADRLRQAAEASEATERRRATAETPPAAADEPARGFFARFRRRRKPAAVAAATPPAPAVAAATPPAPTASPIVRPAPVRTAAAPVSSQPEPASPAPADRPAPAAGRPPVRLSALAFTPAKPADRPARVSTTTAEFDKPGAETITASRRTGSERTPSKPPLDDEQTLAVLAGVLDDLGAAHHRPFSRE